jgi:hypothetical protein
VGSERGLSNQRGSALVAVLAVLFALTVLFISAMSFAISQYGQHVKDTNRLVASHLAEAGIAMAQANHLIAAVPLVDSLHTASNGGTFWYEMIAWGPYLLAISEGSYANQRCTVTAVLGNRPPSLFKGAVSVCDERYPFTVSGSSRITGDVRVGPLSMTTGQIRGESPPPDSFHRGSLIISPSLDPPHLDTTIFQTYLRESSTREQNATSIKAGSLSITKVNQNIVEQNVTVVVENDVELNSAFLTARGQVRSLVARGSIELKGGTTCVGPLELRSGGYILVQDSCSLQGALLYAPDSIVFRHSSRFSGVAVSRGKIAFRDRAVSAHPTALCVMSTGTIDSTGIFLQSRSKLEAVCMVSSPPADSVEFPPTILLDTATALTGYILSNCLADIRGTVYGSIVTERFNYYLTPTTYVNWIRNAVIDRSKMTYSMPLPILVSDRQDPLSILSWYEAH